MTGGTRLVTACTIALLLTAGSVAGAATAEQPLLLDGGTVDNETAEDIDDVTNDSAEATDGTANESIDEPLDSSGTDELTESPDESRNDTTRDVTETDGGETDPVDGTSGDVATDVDKVTKDADVTTDADDVTTDVDDGATAVDQTIDTAADDRVDATTNVRTAAVEESTDTLNETIGATTVTVDETIGETTDVSLGDDVALVDDSDSAAVDDSASVDDSVRDDSEDAFAIGVGGDGGETSAESVVEARPGRSADTGVVVVGDLPAEPLAAIGVALAGLLGVVTVSSTSLGLPSVSSVNVTPPRHLSSRAIASRVARAGARYPWTYFVSTFLYNRHDDSDPLDHPLRRSLYETIVDEPGVYLSQLDEMNDASLSTLRHHVRILEAESLVKTKKIRGKRRCFAVEAGNVALDAALSEPATRRLLETLAALGSAHNKRLADELGRHPSTISHHLSALEKEGLVVRERDGRTTVNRLAPDSLDELGGDDPAEWGGDPTE